MGCCHADSREQAAYDITTLFKTQTMKFNLVSITLGSLAALTLVVAPFGMMRFAHAEGGGRGHHLEQLNLSDEQAAQIEALRTSAHDQMEAILTDEQRTALESSENQGRRAWRQLDLSEDQRSQLRTIRESTREQIGALLTDEQRQQMEAMHEGRRGRRGGRGGHLEQLDLTDAQSAEIEAIRTNTRSQMEALLTDEQRTALENSEAEGRRAWRQLDLSEEQRSQMRELREASREQVQGVLTEEQRQQLEELHGEGRGRRGQGQQGRGPNASR